MTYDPTRNTMLQCLQTEMGDELDEFDREEAIYWFANDYHGGQWSNLYEALCASPYRPGACASGVSLEGMAGCAYATLEREFND